MTTLTHRIPFVTAPAPPCPACDTTGTVRACAQVFGALQPGDLVLCLECSAVCVVTDGGALRMFQLGDFDHYSLGDLAHVIEAVQQMRTVYARRN